ncbi:MAG TPA: hypothetical protein PLR99_18175 [Polyangiaceae bacterium]|jgi:hypothetical protein|nr:hypothetical protein [Polyangiaceae bacterium]
MAQGETGGHTHEHRDGAGPTKDGRVRLPVLSPAAHAGGHKPPWDWARWIVLLLGASSVGLFAASFFRPWWSFKLYAPQYPKGLGLEISLTGMGGDVHEIDLLNHYIGMKHLSDAAAVERHLAGYGVAAIGVLTLAALALSGKKLNKLVAIPALAFPIVFLLDSFYWLYSYGHELDPKAPLHIAPFTPQMFGNGIIGQFETFAAPSAGFWLAIGGVACAVAGNLLRSRVCDNCGHSTECNAVCPRVMVLPERAPREPR